MKGRYENMGYKTQYTGPQIDEALGRGMNLRVVNNGWIRLESTSTTPTDLSTLKNPGNYLTPYWVNGPDIGEGLITPLNVVVVRVNDVLYQYADINGIKYSRDNSVDGSVYGQWSINQSAGSVNVGPTSPANPVNNKTLWLDTSNPEMPSLKAFVNDVWKDVIPNGALQKNIYDTQGKATDIFEYIDTAIENADLGTVTENIDEHLNDTTIHVTPEEKAKWDNSATLNDLNTEINQLKTELSEHVDASLEGETSGIGEVATAIADAENAMNEHISDTVIHPSAEKQAEWDSKASMYHEHNLDGKVTISPNDIDGRIPVDLLPYTLKERVYVVGSEEERLEMEKNPLHNGDMVCVDDGSGTLKWYYVTNDENLGITDEGTYEIEEYEVPPIPRTFYDVCYGNDKFVTITTVTSNIFAYSSDGITWKETTVGSVGAQWNSVCYGNGKFVAVGYRNIDPTFGVFAYSSDGITWTQSDIGTVYRVWNSVCYGNDKFVAVATSTKFAYSSDGINWTEGTISGVTRAWSTVCYGNDKFVAVIGNGNLNSAFAYSSDGITWTEGNISETARCWNSVCYGNGKFVAIAGSTGNSAFAYSSDGITWTEGTISSTSRSWIAVCYGNDKFVAVTYGFGYFAYSSDGIDWVEAPFQHPNWRSVCYGNDKFVAVANNNKFAYSSDGITWTEDTIASSLQVTGICYGNGAYVYVGIRKNYGNYCGYSTDGINWSFKKISNTARNWYSVCYGNDKFVAVAYNDTTFAYSSDGITWTEGTISDTGRHWCSVCYGKDKFVVISGSANPSTIFAYSSDGITWTEGTISDTGRNWNSVCYGNDKFVVISMNTTTFAYSSDGITWTEGTISDTSRTWRYICYGNDKFVVTSFNNTLAYSSDGITWTEVIISDISKQWNCICYGNGKFVTVAYANKFLYSSDGINWLQGDIGNIPRTWYLVCYGDGKFVSVDQAVNGLPNYGFVLSDLALVAENAYIHVNTLQDLTWENITNKPTTLDGYGITDALSKNDIAEVETKISEVEESVNEVNDELVAVIDTQTTYNQLLANMETMDAALTKLEDTLLMMETIAQ